MPLPIRLSSALLGAASTLALTSLAQAQPISEARLVEALAASESGPLLQEVEYGGLEITALAGGSADDALATLFDVQIAGQDLDSLSFEVRGIDGNRFTLSNFALPPSLTFEDAGIEYSLTWDDFTLSGVYNFSALSYEDVALDLSGLALTSSETDLDMRLESLSGMSRFSSETQTLSSSFSGQGLAVSLIDAGTPIDMTAPGFSLRSSGKGFEAGQNPLALMGQQLGASLNMTGAAPMPAPVVGDSGSLTMQFEGMDVVVGGPAPIDLSLGSITLIGATQDHLTPGEALAHYTYVVDGFTFNEPGTRTTMTAGTLSGIYVLDQMDLSQSSPLYSEALYEEGPDYGPLADMIPALGLISGRFTMKDLSVRAPIDGVAADLERLDMELAADLSGDLGSFGLNFNFGGLHLDGFEGPLFDDLSPQTASLGVTMTNLDLAALEALFRAVPRSGPITDEQAIEQDMQRLIPDLISWWQGSQAILNPALNYVAKATTIEAGGALPFDPFAAYGLAGNMELRVHDYEAMLQRLSEAQGQGSLEEQQVAQSLQFGLGMGGGFGDLQDDGTLVFDLALDPSGQITVNGLPLPF